MKRADLLRGCAEKVNKVIAGRDSLPLHLKSKESAMNTDLHFSSERQDWRTPPTLFAALDRAFQFNIDAAANDYNHLCETYFSQENSAFLNHWRLSDGSPGRVWLNPPYGREQPKFIRKAASEIADGNAELVVLLIPARPDTKVWQEVIFPSAQLICWMKGRIRFGVGEENEEKDAAPFASALVMFSQTQPTVSQKTFLKRFGAITDMHVAALHISPISQNLF